MTSENGSEGAEQGPVSAATELSLAAATHLTAMHAGPVAALRVLAKKIDDLRFEVARVGDDSKATFDNVTIPTYLKYCESLGLTPAGAVKLDLAPKETSGGKLASLQSVQQRRRSA